MSGRNQIIGALTIGQSPRTDVIPEIQKFFGDAEILQAGALDGLSRAEIDALAPEAGSGDVLVSRLSDGSWATMAEAKLIPLLQRQAEALCASGAKLLVLLCTGKFPDVLRVGVPVVYPQRLLYAVVPVLSGGRRVGVVNPDAKQLEQSQRNWGDALENVFVMAANPYQQDTDWDAVAETLVEERVELVVLDCIGYTRKVKERIQEKTGKPVILPRTLLARVVGELL